ncbi:HD-GYP domain-containing protein [Thalassobacillus hwangdonensis]|uniref:HD-GYP domain-containing protein n=1 Tax=Thalassobacillus hwangdonensis TaxID=546108 RepID=A0ABW3L4F8_9BACI
MSFSPLDYYLNVYSPSAKDLLEQLRKHDAITYQHSLQVTDYYVRFCDYWSLSKMLVPSRVLSVLLHDIGKLQVPKRILQKRSPLTNMEWHILKGHPRYGTEILSDHTDIKLEPDVVLYHHENLDGSGYLYGLQGARLDSCVRILRIIDSYDAMISARSYGKVFTPGEALEDLRKHGDTHYDADYVDLFEEFIREKSMKKSLPL